MMVGLELEYERATVSGGQLAYADLGEGPPVLLLHGFPTSSFLWRREAWLLAQRMRVIVPDMLGYGRSEKPKDADLSEEAQAGYLRELLARLGIEELAVVGHDLGGAFAQMLALDHGPAVRAMVLVDSVCFEAWPIEGVKMLQGATPEQETQEFVESVIRLTFDLGISHQGRIDEATLRAYLEPWLEDPGAFFRATRAITGRGLAGREPELGALDIPTFVIWGEEDPFLDAALGERLGETIPASTVALLPGCSHFVNEDAPQTVGPLIYEYLRSRYLGVQGGSNNERSEAAADPLARRQSDEGGVSRRR
ncbi:MAG TPA: alpha/beta hydrolase [Actinomycetota bacterium]